MVSRVVRQIHIRQTHRPVSPKDPLAVQRLAPKVLLRLPMGESSFCDFIELLDY